MKPKKWLFIIITLFGLLALCAFGRLPSTCLSRDQKPVSTTVCDAQITEDKLIITVSYDSHGNQFEIGKDICVALDANFTTTLKMEKCVVSDGSYVYEFLVDNPEEIDRIYIAPPILYMPAVISPVSIPLREGSAMKTKNLDVAKESDDAAWFSISSVEVEEGSEETFIVVIRVEACSFDLPRFPKLMIEDAQFGGISALYFDENDRFETGEFQFYVKADTKDVVEEVLNDASLRVNEALLRIDSELIAVSSNTKAIVVLTGKGCD